MELHHVERLLVDVGVDHLQQHVLDQVLDLGAIPALREGEHALLEALHLALVRPDQEIDELRVRTAEQLTARDHPRSVQRPRQRER